MAFDPFGQKRRTRRARERGAARRKESTERKALVREQESCEDESQPCT